MALLVLLAPGGHSSRRLWVRVLLMLMPSSPALVLCLLALLALLVLLSQMPQERALHLPQHRATPAMLCPPPAAHWADPLPAATISCDCGVRVDSVECRQRTEARRSGPRFSALLRCPSASQAPMDRLQVPNQMQQPSKDGWALIILC